MSIKSLFIYTLSLMLGFGAVAHAKTQLVEQRLQEAAQTEGLAFRTRLPGHPGFQSSNTPNQWHRLQWTV